MPLQSGASMGIVRDAIGGVVSRAIMTAPNPTDDRDAESRRILRRAAVESDSSAARRAFGRAARHMTARDKEAGDAVELWALRGARVLSLVLTVAILLWLLFLVLGG